MNHLAKFADVFFVVFHTSLIIFNLFGWIFRRLRKANLVTLLLTGASWFILGIFYGFGFCPFTEWHWAILHRLGQYNLPDSYVSYLIERLSGYRPDPGWVGSLTVILYIAALGISVYVNFFNKKK